MRLNLNSLIIFSIFSQFFVDIFYSLIVSFNIKLIVYFPKILILILMLYSLWYIRFSIRELVLFIFIFVFFLYSIFFNTVTQATYHIYLLLPLFIPIFFKKIDIFSKKYFRLYLFIFFISSFSILFSFLFDFKLNNIFYLDNGLFERISQRQESVFNYYRHNGFFRTWDLAASYVAIFGFFVIYYDSNYLRKFIYIIISLIAIFLTTTKSIFLGFFVLLLIYFFQSYKKIYISVILIIFLLLSLTFISITSNEYSNTFGNNPFLASLELRVFKVWKVIITNFQFFGNGFGSIGTPTYLKNEIVASDNNYYHLIYIFGFFAIYFISRFIQKVFLIYKFGHNKILVFYGILILICSLVTDVIQFIPFKILMGLIYFYNFEERRVDENS